METPAQIDFQGMQATDKVRTEIDEQIADLEARYGRVTACRVALKAPSARHKNGGLYDINVRLTLPSGREVNIGRTASQDERHADLSFALNDAFKRAKRMLQDEVDLMRGNVKARG
jgi:hypothetical protein